MNSSGIIYHHDWPTHTGAQPTAAAHSSPSIPLIFECSSMKKSKASPASWTRLLGISLVALALGGLTGPLVPVIRLESRYAVSRAIATINTWHAAWATPGRIDPKKVTVAVETPQAVPAVFSPLKNPDGSHIAPIDQEFGLVIPKIGVNAKIIPRVDPTKPGEYLPALLQGIAHASTSFLPDEDGTVYLFSHSTNYDWFVQDLNAVFYLLKNLEEKDQIVLLYKQKTYVYTITEKRVVAPSAISYLVPQTGTKKLILQTCWPPGSTTQRLLLFADLVEQPNQRI